MELVVDAKIDRLDEVLDFIDSFLEESGCNMKALNQINIAAEEIFVNIAHYSGSEKARITITESDGTVSITFADTGTPYDPLSRPDPDVTLSAEERGIGGLGIFLTKKIMDSVSYERKDGYNIFTMCKRMKS
ncbi:MAG: ATP-binding protein [Synergistaceae bacterium]|nr:ATP-binding protein [Synergistaceae bacterium]MBQ7168697.1 ATP-binding protein [Synergistaceae bacterium]